MSKTVWGIRYDDMMDWTGIDHELYESKQDALDAIDAAVKDEDDDSPWHYSLEEFTII